MQLTMQEIFIFVYDLSEKNDEYFFGLPWNSNILGMIFVYEIVMSNYSWLLTLDCQVCDVR